MSGWLATAEDAATYAAFGENGVTADAARRAGFKNAARWLAHMATFSEGQRAAWTADGSLQPKKPMKCYAPAPVPGKLPPVTKPTRASPPAPSVSAANPETSKKIAAAANEEEDDFDVFGDDDEEEEAEAVSTMSRAEKAAALKKQRDEELEKAKQAALERLAKKEAKQRTLCNLEITPWEADQDLIALHKKLKETVVREGLKWSEGCKLVDVGYGIKKMLLTAVLSMNLSMDAIIEEVADEDEGILKDEIQSFTMTSMSLL